jgi:hypothetical protein
MHTLQHILSHHLDNASINMSFHHNSLPCRECAVVIVLACGGRVFLCWVVRPLISLVCNVTSVGFSLIMEQSSPASRETKAALHGELITFWVTVEHSLFEPCTSAFGQVQLTATFLFIDHALEYLYLYLTLHFCILKFGGDIVVASPRCFSFKAGPVQVYDRSLAPPIILLNVRLETRPRSWC